MADGDVTQPLLIKDILAKEAAIRQLLEAEISAGRLSKWVMPERIDIVAEIPKTSVGKLDKKVMRQRHAH